MGVTERDLILPALTILDDANSEVSTTELSQRLRKVIKPQGDDLDILSRRKDDKFSQKVRNLRSHKTLEEHSYATYESRGHQGFWMITETGREVARQNQEFANVVFESEFTAPVVTAALRRLPLASGRSRRKVLVFDENSLVTEGGRTKKERAVYQRTSKLRDRAIEDRQARGQLQCEVCGFNFEQMYGKIGRGFIEIHHLIPIFCLDGESVEKTLEESLNDVAALCANCHRMVRGTR